MTKANLLFPTPVWTVQLENYEIVNEEMYDYIKKHQSSDHVGINKSNIKGWHSKDFDLSPFFQFTLYIIGPHAYSKDSCSCIHLRSPLTVSQSLRGSRLDHIILQLGICLLNIFPTGAHVC